MLLFRTDLKQPHAHRPYLRESALTVPLAYEGLTVACGHKSLSRGIVGTRQSTASRVERSVLKSNVMRL